MTTYKLLENGEPALESTEFELEHEEVSPPLSKSKRRYLELQQSIKDLLGYSNERKGSFRGRVPPWLDPFCNCRTLSFIVGGIFVAIFIVLVVASAFGGDGPRDDILRYIDPLIGTGPGGHVFAGATLPFGMAKPVADVAGEKEVRNPRLQAILLVLRHFLTFSPSLCRGVLLRIIRGSEASLISMILALAVLLRW